MQYHLDTIPVWEAMEKQCTCPLCLLHQKCEEMEVERSLGGSVMEPDARIEVNERGLCSKHHGMLFVLQNRLGHALLTDSHSKELLKKVESIKQKANNPVKGGLFAKSSPALDVAKALENLTNTCVICEAVEDHLGRYLYTFLYMWKKETAFREKWEASKGVCIPHATMLAVAANQHLSGKQQQDFLVSLLAHLQQTLSENEKDLEWFTLKFDYRNHDKPWGNSKNALERSINHLRGQCIVSEEEKS